MNLSAATSPGRRGSAARLLLRRAPALGPVLLCVVALAGCGDGGRARGAAADLVDLPTVPLADLEPPLAALIGERVAAVRRAPRDAAAWGALAIAYDAHDYRSEALQCYERAAALAPEDPKWPYLGGSAAYLGDQASAIAWLDRAEQRGSQHPPLFVRRGLGRLLVGDLAGARADLTRATELDPTLVAAWLGLARVELSEDAVDEAAKALERAQGLGPRSGEVHVLAAEVHRRRGEEPEASVALDRAEGLAPREPLPDVLRAEVESAGVTLTWTRRRVQGALERQDVDGALAEWERAAERAPDDPSIGLAIAALQLRAHRLADARSSLQRVGEVLARQGASAEAEARAQFELQSGVVDLSEDQLEGAAAHFEAALAIDPTLHDARGNLGLVRLRQGNTAAGLEHLRTASEGLDANEPLRMNLLTAVVDTGAWHEAEVLVGEHLAASPDDPVLVFLRGRVHAGQRRFAEAAKDFARVAELVPSHESAPVNEARAYLAQGDEARAAATLLAAHERLSESRLIMQRLAWLLATARDDAVADGPRAQLLAKRVLAFAPEDPEYLTLTAAAFAAAGDFHGAGVHERLALQMLEKLPEAEAPTRRPQLLAEMRARLAEYEAGRRWREPAPKPPAAPR